MSGALTYPELGTQKLLPTCQSLVLATKTRGSYPVLIAGVVLTGSKRRQRSPGHRTPDPDNPEPLLKDRTSPVVQPNFTLVQKSEQVQQVPVTNLGQRDAQFFALK